jgi:hypothetical protein
VVRERPTLITTAMSRLASAHPPVRDYDQHKLDATAEDLGYIADFLAAALYISEPAVFTEFVDWTAAVLAARGVPPMALRSGLTLIQNQLRDFPTAHTILDTALAGGPERADRRGAKRAG